VMVLDVYDIILALGDQYARARRVTRSRPKAGRPLTRNSVPAMLNSAARGPGLSKRRTGGVRPRGAAWAQVGLTRGPGGPQEGSAG